MTHEKITIFKVKINNFNLIDGWIKKEKVILIDLIFLLNILYYNLYKQENYKKGASTLIILVTFEKKENTTFYIQFI